MTNTFEITERRITIEVTSDHILRGKLPSEERHKCPVALALADHGIPAATAKYSPESRIEVFRFMDDFDAGRITVPFSFEVIV